MEPLKQKLEEDQSAIDLAGDTIKLTLVDRGEGQKQLLLQTITHLLTDQVAGISFINDLLSVYGQLEEGLEPSLPAKTMSFAKYAMILDEYAQSDEIREAFEVFKKTEWKEYQPFPVDQEENRLLNTMGSAGHQYFALERSKTEKLVEMLKHFPDHSIRSIVLCAMVRTTQKWTDTEHVFLDLKYHGRERSFRDFDLSRTLGYFVEAITFPFYCEEDASAFDRLNTIEQQFQENWINFKDFGILKHMSRIPEIQEHMKQLPSPEILLNFVMDTDHDDSGGIDLGPISLIDFPEFNIGKLEDHPELDRKNLFFIRSNVENGEIKLKITYSQSLHDDTTVEKFGNDFLREVITIKKPLAWPVAHKSLTFTVVSQSLFI